jgi:hypothetical protein
MRPSVSICLALCKTSLLCVRSAGQSPKENQRQQHLFHFILLKVPVFGIAFSMLCGQRFTTNAILVLLNLKSK